MCAFVVVVVLLPRVVGTLSNPKEESGEVSRSIGALIIIGFAQICCV